MIDTDRMVGDHLEPVRQRGNDIGGKVFRMTGQHRIDVLAFLDQFGRGKDPVLRIEDRIVIPLQAGLNGVGQASRHQYHRFFGHAVLPAVPRRINRSWRFVRQSDIGLRAGGKWPKVKLCG